MRILAADIGGTNSRFALFDTAPLRMLHCETVSSRMSGFLDVLDCLVAACPELAPEKSDLFALAVAGPVMDAEKIKPSNLPYVIDVSQAREARGFGRAILINDFLAQAWACLTPAMDDALPLIDPEVAGVYAGEIYTRPFRYPSPDPLLRGLPCALVGAGTGLGMAVLVASGEPASRPWDNVRVLASEGGHAAFPFQREDEFAFAAFALERTGLDYMRLDDIVTGRGLALLHLFLTGEDLPPEEITASSDFSMSRTCELFARFYGRVCRNMALTVLPGNGLVVTGGLATHCRHLVRHPSFTISLTNAPGDHHALLANTPFWLNTNQYSGLWGAAMAGMAASD